LASPLPGFRRPPHMASSGTASFRRQNQRARTKKRKKEKTRDQERHTTAPMRCICRPAAACLSPQPAVPATASTLPPPHLAASESDLLCHRPLRRRPVRIVKSRGSPGGIMPPARPRPCPLRARGHGQAAASPTACARACMRLLVRTRSGLLFVSPLLVDPSRLPTWSTQLSCGSEDIDVMMFRVLLGKLSVTHLRWKF